MGAVRGADTVTAYRPFAASLLALVLSAACLPPPRMCAQESDCGAQASCVAGRCVAHGAMPAIDSARRLLVEPADVGYVLRGDDDGARTAAVARLGRAGQPGIVFLRFAAPLAPEVRVLEAYLLLERAPDVDVDPATVPLHAARVIGPWDSRSLSWARQPRVEEVGAAVTRVVPGGGPLVRLDVRDLVQRWRGRARDELGVAIVADAESPTGVALALAPLDRAHDRDDPALSAPGGPSTTASLFEPRASAPAAVGDPRRQTAGPRLELYVK